MGGGMDGRARTCTALLVLVLVLATAGCASSRQWWHDGVSAEQRERDTVLCEIHARQIAGPQGPAEALGYRFGIWLTESDTPYERCMRNLGYREVPGG